MARRSSLPGEGLLRCASSSCPNRRKSDMQVEGKSVVVTGGGNGIGRALALRFASLGVRGVTIGDLDGEWAHQAAAKIEKAGVPALGMACDVGDQAAVETLVDTA